nr:hypothetical protein [Tanacetum cinerariifolium]
MIKCEVEWLKAIKVEMKIYVIGKESRIDDDGVLDVFSLDSRFNVKKVMCGLRYRCESSDDWKYYSMHMQCGSRCRA